MQRICQNKQMKIDLSTEEKIKAAAKKVFMTKGFDGCSVRDIAKEVGSNVALLNYYFRSKEKLFELIFEGAMSDFLQSIIEVFSSDLPLQEKTSLLIDKEFDFFMEHPELPMFIIQAIQQNNFTPQHAQEVIDREQWFQTTHGKCVWHERPDWKQIYEKNC